MTDSVKTMVYVGVALITIVAAYVARPKQDDYQPREIVGKPLFEFDKPEDAASLKIVRYNEELGELDTFEVAKDSQGRWSIPSHAKYPADAEDQMRDAATALYDLKVLGIATELANEHKIFGVVEPDVEVLKAGDEGVGTLVVIKDGKGKELAKLVIGEEVPQREGQHFVRRPEHDAVYAVEVDPSKLSTKFSDWIEKDLLKLSTIDVEEVTLKDYAVIKTIAGLQLEFDINRRHDISVAWDSDDSKWKLGELVTYSQNKPVPGSLSEFEELNTSRLDDLKTALGDLKIVDVDRKPEGLGVDLKVGTDFMKDRENITSLFEKGFFPLRVGNADPELLSANGEVHIGMKNGVDYVLRFGNIAGADEDSEDGSLNRYLFVSARFDEAKFPEPELTPLPELPAEKPATVDPKPADDPEASGDKTPAENSDDPAAKPVEDAKPTDESDDSDEADDEEQEPADETTADDEPAADSPADDKQDDDPPAEQDPPADPAAADDPKPADDGDDDPNAAEEDEVKRLAIEKARERIQTENDRKLDEHKKKVTEAKAKVVELNARFADWYYVISEDVYKKIHLGRGDIISESEEAKKEGFGIEAFRNLQKEGIDKPADSPATLP